MEIDIKKLKEFSALLEEFIEFLEAKEAAQTPTEEPIEEPIEKPTDKPTEPMVDLTGEPIEDPIIDPVIEPVVEPIDEPIVQTAPLTELDALVDEILEDKWGSGATRKQKLEEAGYDYDTVQGRVNEILKVVQEVLDRKWGNGDERKQKLIDAGYSYDTVQRQINRQLSVNSHDQTINNMNAWAKKIAADNRYHYNKWNSSQSQSKVCPICTGLKYENDKTHFGWNCIGFGAAVWHHGGGLDNKCNCSWITGPGGTGDKLLSVSSDSEALSLAKKYTGINDIQVIRNKNGIPKSQWKAGDICLQFSGTKFIHVFYYMGDGKIADSTGSNGKVANNNQIAVRSYNNYSAKVIIRWTGK